MKVLIYTHEFPPFLGGLATTSLKLARGISGSGIEAVVLAPSYGANDKEIDGKLGCRVIRVSGLGGKWIKALPFGQILLGLVSLLSSLRSEKPDAVLFITEEAEAAGGRGATMTGLARSFLQQLTAVDSVYLDVQPVDEGARLKGRVTLRPR